MAPHDLPAALAPAVRLLWSGRGRATPPLSAAGPVARTVAGQDLSADLVRRCETFTRGSRDLLRQQSTTTCGPNVLAMFRTLTDPGYLPRATARRDAGHWGQLEDRLQQAMNRGVGALPWPPAWGTLPWALAHQLQALPGGRPWRVRRADPLAPDRVRDLLETGGRWCRAGLPVPGYVGNDRLPRHVVLLLAADPHRVTLYDPAIGAVRRLATADMTAGTASVAGWGRVWCVLLPDTETGL